MALLSLRGATKAAVQGRHDSRVGYGRGYKKSITEFRRVKTVFKRLCEVLAQSRNNDLRRQVQSLKAENEILGSRIKGRIRPSRAEHDRLVRLGKPLGPAIKEVNSIVSPKTFAKWLRLKKPRITRKRKCHLDHLLAEYIDYHNRERPHSSLDFAAPMGRPPPARAGPVDPREVRCRERLGGVLKHYYRKAA